MQFGFYYVWKLLEKSNARLALFNYVIDDRFIDLFLSSSYSRHRDKSSGINGPYIIFEGPVKMNFINSDHGNFREASTLFPLGLHNCYADW